MTWKLIKVHYHWGCSNPLNLSQSRGGFQRSFKHLYIPSNRNCLLVGQLVSWDSDSTLILIILHDVNTVYLSNYMNNSTKLKLIQKEYDMFIEYESWINHTIKHNNVFLSLFFYSFFYFPFQVQLGLCKKKITITVALYSCSVAVRVISYCTCGFSLTNEATHFISNIHCMAVSIADS